jgi:hypothetical protein
VLLFSGNERPICGKWASFLIAATAIFGAARSSAASTWTDQASGGFWTNAPNWSGGVPNSVGAIADFSTLDITADDTVHLNAPETVSSLLFGDTNPSNNWHIAGPLSWSQNSLVLMMDPS